MKKTIFIIALLLLSILAIGCSKEEQDVQITKVNPAKVVTTTKTPTTTTTTTVKQPEPQMTLEEEEAKAVEAATQFVKNLDGYKSQNGRSLDVLNAAKSGCTGCWIIEMSFTRDLLYYPDKIEYIKVNVNLKNWKMDSYTFG